MRRRSEKAGLEVWQRIGQVLLENELISDEDLKEAQRIQRNGSAPLAIKPGEALGRVLIRMGRVDAMEVVRALCRQQSIGNYLLVGRFIVSPALVARVPLEIARRYNILPIISFGEDSREAILAAPAVPSAEETNEIEQLLDLSIEWIEVKDRRFSGVIDRVYSIMAERGVRSVRIGEVLIREGLATKDEIEWALKLSTRTKTRIGTVLIEEGLISEPLFYRVLAQHEGVPLATAEEILADDEAPVVAARLSRGFAVFNEIVPFRLDRRELHVAASRTDADLTQLRKIYSCRKVNLHLVTPSDMLALMKVFYQLTDDEAARKGLAIHDDSGDVAVLCDVGDRELDAELEGEDLTKLRRRYESLVSNLLHEAIRRRASDIHIETYEKFVAVRIRIDGLLYDARTLRIDKSNVAGVVNVIKVLSDINIAEHRLPQGGRFRKKTPDGHMYDFRVQCQPTLFGENIVIRILNQSASIVPLKDLGFSQRRLDRFLQVMINPSGLILITGPTGSGKTTTLYSALDLLRRDTTKKIVTIEDPIEYSLPRIQQSQVIEAIDYDFASATRAFLREDPDVALVGEIRDEETARETIKLSQTGHLVFSTLHTNNAIGAASRMLVLGVDPEILASELLTVVAQRLARRICPQCRAAYQPEKSLLDDFYPLGVPPETTFYHGEGCPACDGLGHTGRIVVSEFWFMDAESRVLVSRREEADKIMAAAIGKNFMPLLADALEKVHAGLVDISELPLVLPMVAIANTARLIQEHQLVEPLPRAAG